ncbi:MAG: type II toxin-antitoxin system PemK/MazF family toxin [Solirubrobacterales bacterium]
MVCGEVVQLAAPRRARGHEQHGPRPGVVVQADELLELSTVLIAPTSRSAAPATFRPLIHVSQTSTRVLTDQLRVFDLRSVTGTLGHLTRAELESVDDALALILGLRL